MGWDDNGPTMVAISLCNVLVELIVGAVWLGLWLDYDMAANCDKELQWWYLFILGGMLFGLVCEVGVAISAKIRSETLIQMCKILCTLDQLFELGVMLWGVALAWGTKSDRVDTGGCKVLAMFQKINVTAILIVCSLVVCMIGVGGDPDEKSTEMTSIDPTSRVMSGSRYLVRQGSLWMGLDDDPGLEPPILCNILMELIFGAVCLGLWLDYDMTENCDKKLQLWYLLLMGGILFGLVCEFGVIISAKIIGSDTFTFIFKGLYYLDNSFELCLMLWGLGLGYGKKKDRIDTGGCKVPAMFQKISVMFILCLYSVWAFLDVQRRKANEG